MKRVSLVCLIIIVGSLVTAALRSFFGIEITSEVLGEFGGIAFTVMYMVWGGFLALYMDSFMFRRKTDFEISDIKVEIVRVSQNPEGIEV